MNDSTVLYNDSMIYQSLFKISPYSDENFLLLYIHLYIGTLQNSLRKMDLLDGSDYYIRSLTHNNQLLQINIALVTEKAKKAKNILHTQEPDFRPKNTKDNIKKVEASKNIKLTYHQEEIESALAAIHQLPWQTFAQFDAFIPSATVKTLFTVHQPSKVNRSHFIVARLNEDYLTKHPLHAALFWYIHQTLLYEFRAALSRHLGCVLIDSKSRYVRGHAIETLEVQFIRDIDVQDTIEFISDTYDQLLSDGLVESLIAFFQTDFHNLPLGGIDESELYDKLKLVLGETGWRSLATTENIQSVLRNTMLYFGDLSEEKVIRLSIPKS